MHLDPDISMMVASTVRLAAPGAAARTLDDARESGAAIVRLVGDVIADVDGARDGTLHLTWARGDVMGIFDTWPQNESYTIRHGTTTLVV